MASVSSTKETPDIQQICVEAKELALKIQSQLDQKKEPVDTLNELNLLLNSHSRELIQFIGSDTKLKSEFYKVVLKQTAD